MTGNIEPMVGRYVHVEIDGTPHRIYFEEAGSGIPLVCLHTAGSDGRQWRYLIADERIHKILPHHRLRYALARQVESAGELGRQRIPAHHRALHADDPRLLCSARSGQARRDGLLDRRPHRTQSRDRYASEFRALIGLEAADFQAPWYDTTWLNRPDIHGGEVCAALVSGLVAPQSPAEARMETLWAYKQGGPGVFKGDLYFYRVDGDLRGRTKAIDTNGCPLYLLTGEYDFSCMPEDTLRTASGIASAEVTIMEELGHFPMSENPAQFRRYIAPVLEKIQQQQTF